MSARIRVFLGVFMTLLVAGCAAPKGEPMPMMTFAHLKPIQINVSQIDVSSDYQGGNEAFFMMPDEAVQNYLQTRFYAAGQAGVLKAFIEESSVHKSYVPSDSQIGQYLDVGGLDRYEVGVALRLEHRDARDTALYGKIIRLKRIINVPEHASLSEREQHQLEGMEILFQDLDREVRRIVLEEMHLQRTY
jgi:hypothetical protein